MVRFLSACTAIALGGLISGCNRVGADGPVLGVPERLVNLGPHDPGGATFSVPIENRGDAELIVSEIISSCTCTIPEAPPAIPPGGTGTIRGTVTVATGPGTAKLVIHHNAGEPEVVLLKWMGNAEPVLLPPVVSLDVRRGGTATADVVVSYPGGDPEMGLTVEAITGLPDFVTLDVVADEPEAIVGDPSYSALRASGSTTLVLKVDAPATVGDREIFGAVEVEQAGRRFELPLTFELRVHDGIVAAPQRLLMSAADRESLVGRRSAARLEAVGPTDLEVVDHPGFLEATLSAEGDGSYRLGIEVISVPPERTGTYEVSVAGGDGSSIAVPVRVVCLN